MCGGTEGCGRVSRDLPDRGHQKDRRTEGQSQASQMSLVSKNQEAGTFDSKFPSAASEAS